MKIIHMISEAGRTSLTQHHSDEDSVLNDIWDKIICGEHRNAYGERIEHASLLLHTFTGLHILDEYHSIKDSDQDEEFERQFSSLRMKAREINFARKDRSHSLLLLYGATHGCMYLAWKHRSVPRDIDIRETPDLNVVEMTMYLERNYQSLVSKQHA